MINKHLTDEVVYLSAMEEAKFTIAQANATMDSRNRLTDELVSCRKGGNFVMTTPDQVRVHRRFAQAAGVGGRGAGAVPGE